MKTLLIFLILLSFNLFAGTVKTEGTLGAPSRDCRGMGVCESTTTTSEMVESISMVWELNQAKNLVRLHLNKKELKEFAPEQYAELDGARTVFFSDPTYIDASICLELGLEGELEFAPGDFRVESNSEEFIILFPL